MQKLIFAFVIMSFLSCNSKKWNKEYVAEKCNADFKKRNEKEKMLTNDQLTKICDCVADKMSTNYKSEAEADKDPTGAAQIGTDCATAVMMPPSPTPMEPMPVDTTHQADTSNQ